MTLSDKLYKILIEGGSWKTILSGLWVTVKISLFSLIIGTLLGAFICLLRTCKNPVLRTIAKVYIAILRGTPVLMLLLLLYYGIFARTGLEPVTVAIVTFSLNVSAHVAELLRAAVEASDKGQTEGIVNHSGLFRNISTASSSAYHNISGFQESDGRPDGSSADTEALGKLQLTGKPVISLHLVVTNIIDDIICDDLGKKRLFKIDLRESVCHDVFLLSSASVFCRKV